MPGLYGDLRNMAYNANMENWNLATIVSTSAGIAADGWVLGLGTGSTYIVSRASTGQDSGSFAAGISYTHAVRSDIHQVMGVLAALKSETVSCSFRVASATAGACRPFISEDGGTTRTYGQANTGAGATTYETLKVEGVTISSSATAVWYGLELNKTATILFDAAAFAFGSAAETSFTPTATGGAAWTHTSGATVRVVDATATATSVMNVLRTLVMDLQNLGVLP
jgi:hypothetical protein